MCIDTNITPNGKPVHVKPSFYAYYFEPLKVIALKYGYNLCMHGSMKRDFDLVAIPWKDVVDSSDEMVIEMSKYMDGWIIKHSKEQGLYNILPGGRKSYVINLNRSTLHEERIFDNEGNYVGLQEVDAQYYLDISVTPIV
jgi:hypothetical protein